MRILLTEAGVQALHDPLNGPELFQALLKRFQANLMGNMLMATRDDWELLQRYADGTGDPAASGRARDILAGAEPG